MEKRKEEGFPPRLESAGRNHPTKRCRVRAGRAHGDGKEVVVPCLTLDELELGRLDLIKVDTHTYTHTHLL